MNVGLPMKPAGAVEATVRPSAILTSSASPLIDEARDGAPLDVAEQFGKDDPAQDCACRAR